jgi:hypothetical protein
MKMMIEYQGQVHRPYFYIIINHIRSAVADINKVRIALFFHVLTTTKCQFLNSFIIKDLLQPLNIQLRLPIFGVNGSDEMGLILF